MGNFVLTKNIMNKIYKILIAFAVSLLSANILYHFGIDEFLVGWLSACIFIFILDLKKAPD